MFTGADAVQKQAVAIPRARQVKVRHTTTTSAHCQRTNGTFLKHLQIEIPDCRRLYI